MLIEEILLLSLTLALTIGIPVYIYFREKMTKMASGRRPHTLRRVVKLTLINFLLNLLVALFSSVFVILLLNRIGFVFNKFLIIQILLYLTFIFATFYGNGIYITSIVLEDFTLPQLRIVKGFKTQFIATHLFHGPVSHIAIYSSWMVVFLILSIVDIYLKIGIPAETWVLLLSAGGITGLLYAIAQIYNGSAIYQFITGILATLILTFALFQAQTSIYYVPVATYFSGFLIIFNLVLSAYFLRLSMLNIGEKYIILDRSGTNKMDTKPLRSSVLPAVTYAEMIIIVALIAILSASSYPFLTSYIGSNNLTLSKDKIISTIRKAQNYSMSQKNGETWGACITENIVRLYTGTCLSPDFKEDFTISNSIEISGTLDTTFSSRGEAVSEAVVTLKAKQTEKHIELNKIGGINVN